MSPIYCVLVFALLVHAAASATADLEDDATSVEEEQTKLKEGEEKLSEYIKKVLNHFQQPNPVGLPGAKIPEPYPVPDTKQSMSMITMNFKNMALYGISKFKILYINMEVGAMEVHGAMLIEKLHVRGNYTMSSWFSRSSGPFTVDLTHLVVTTRASLGVERDGRLRTQDIEIDLAFKTIDMDFKNLGFFGSMFQGMMNSVGNFLFDSIKPFVLKEAYTKMRTEIDTKLDDVAGDIQFPNSISPLDMVITDLRKKVRDMQLDPYKVKDYNTTVSMFSVGLTNTWLMGISSFHRVGNITLKMENNTMIADFEIGTQKLEGKTQWEIAALNGLVNRAGTASFSVEYLSVRAVLGQPLDTRKRPEFRNIDLELGNIQVRCDGAGTLDYVIEFVVNVLPNLLRYQIMDAIEGPLQEKVQSELNKIDIDKMVQEELPKLDELKEKGFKLSALKEIQTVEEPYDEDEFFNF